MFGVSRLSSIKLMGCSWTNLLHLIESPESIFYNKKTEIDALFPLIRESDLSHYHLVAENSLCKIEKEECLIFLNAQHRRGKADNAIDEELHNELKTFIEFHKKTMQH